MWSLGSTQRIHRRSSFIMKFWAVHLLFQGINGFLLLFISILFGRERETYRQAESDKHRKRWRSSICWFSYRPTTARLGLAKARNLDSMQVTYLSGRNSSTWAITWLLPGCTLSRRWIGIEEARTQTKHSDTDCGNPMWYLNHYTKYLPPK